jgi:hypothetical protein
LFIETPSLKIIFFPVSSFNNNTLYEYFLLIYSVLATGLKYPSLKVILRPFANVKPKDLALEYVRAIFE